MTKPCEHPEFGAHIAGTTGPVAVMSKPLRQGRVIGHRRTSTHVGTLIRRALESVDL